MKKILRVVENNRAGSWLRFGNLIIDRIVVLILFMMFGFFASLSYEIFGIEYFINLATALGAVNKFMDIVITSTVYFLYALLMEYFTKGRTVGKFITGTRAISTDGTEPTFMDYFIRNISRLVPFDALSFLGGGNGWHDSWSDTRVINIKNYKAETQIKSEIESIGTKEIA
ncbi:RDD family protein [Chryseobacterium taichungense]|uniref:RDD family protein n=1 Tax=Chryseobacterium taichungense TaxID=295069 RepID=A0A1H7W2W4_9FLAO|nr:RDD family protein [Chryseobacterium taichungense]SEM15347.1 RDD family protein [Chryseobacterium taichungense]